MRPLISLKQRLYLSVFNALKAKAKGAKTIFVRMKWGIEFLALVVRTRQKDGWPNLASKLLSGASGKGNHYGGNTWDHQPQPRSISDAHMFLTVRSNILCQLPSIGPIPFSK